MTTRPRPLLSIRLVGPTTVVTEQKRFLTDHLARHFGIRATCRMSTHSASYSGEIRAYLTVTPKGDG